MTTSIPSVAPVGAAFFAGRVGLWCHDPQTILGHLHDAAAIGADYVLFKISDGASSYHGVDNKTLVHDAATIGLQLGAWAYVRPSNTPAQIQTIIVNIPAGVTDLVLDAEVEWEAYAKAHGEDATKALVDQLCHGIAEATGHRVTLHLSSFWSPQLHPAFPFAAFMGHCATWQPQAYLEPGTTRTPAGILSGAVTQGRPLIKLLPGQRLVPTINNTAFLPFVKLLGFSNFSIYVWDPADGDAQVAVNKAAWTAAIASFRKG
ncbi:hypothetical protein CCAX7_14300 [Capsulimonas corticalis]|uniref:Uncharacterized protein n=1 Tax=Capsulimonas corticalis TaxID=2219043 RepID=A0A402D741_9BACT|nr:hypothetical protein [Capsulimonas corticalis]BDI29379.1 hypothetical protein CCAX7_14300 [Capsulimonas corticalis]